MTAPIRIGILHDMADSVEEGASLGGHVDTYMRFAIDDLIQRARLDREVQFVHAAGMGLPAGTASRSSTRSPSSWRRASSSSWDLPSGTTPRGDAVRDRARVPTINWAGTERARSEFMFHLQVGSHEDEPVLLARHVAELGAQRVGVVFDRSPIGRRYQAFFEAECEVIGLDLAARVPIGPLAGDASRESHPCGPRAPTRRCTSAWGSSAPQLPGADPRGVGCTRGDEHRRAAGLRPRVRARDRRLGLRRHDRRRQSGARRAPCPRRVGFGAGLFAAAGYDLGLLVAEGLARAPELTREACATGSSWSSSCRRPRDGPARPSASGTGTAVRSTAPTSCSVSGATGRRPKSAPRRANPAPEPGPSGKNNYWKYVASGSPPSLRASTLIASRSRRRRQHA